MSAAGRTKTPAHTLSTSPYDFEVCPCGAFRLLFDGEPVGHWEHRNAALDNPTWFTGRSVPHALRHLFDHTH